MDESEKSENFETNSSPEEYEKYYRSIKHSAKENDYLSISSILTDIVDKEKEEKKKLFFDYILRTDKDFYLDIFTDWEIINDFEVEKILPYLDIKELLEYSKNQVIQSREVEGKKKYFLGLYRFFYNYLLMVNICMEYQNPKNIVNEKDILSNLPEHFISIDEDFFQSIRERVLKFLDVNILEHIDDSKFEIGKNFIKTSRNFLNSYNIIPPIDLESLVLDEPLPNRFDLWDKQYDHHLNRAKKNHSEKEFIDSYMRIIDNAIRRFDFNTAGHLVERLLKDFSEKERVIKKYLDVKLEIDELDDMKNFIEKNYSKNAIENNPNFLYYLSEYEKKEGNIRSSVDYVEKAYERSNKDFNFLVHYAFTLSIHNLKRSKKVVKEHIEKGYDSPNKRGLFNLARNYFLKDKDFAKWILTQYKKHFVEEGNLKDHTNYAYLVFRYFFEKRDFVKAKNILERFIEDNPEEETKGLGYRKLLQFYSEKNNDQFFDLDKSLEYAKKCAYVRGIPTEYYTGLSYLNAEKWQEAIDEFESFLEKVPNPPPIYSRIFMHMFKAYMELGQRKEAREVAGKYMEIFEESRSRGMYSRGPFDTELNHLDDLKFFIWVKDEFRTHRKEAERIINNQKLWSNNIKKDKEILELEKDLEELNKENQKIKEKYEDLNLDDEETYDKFLSELENNEEKRAEVLKKLNEENWKETRKECKERYSKFEKIPEDIQNFIKTSEFYLMQDDIDLDFSAVVMFYGKSLETILDYKVGLPFLSEMGSISENKRGSIENKYVKRLFSSDKYNHKSISLGQWSTILRQRKEGWIFGDDKITQEFADHVDSILTNHIETVRKNTSDFADLRNSKVHTKKLPKNEIEREIDTLREGMEKIINIFY